MLTLPPQWRRLLAVLACIILPVSGWAVPDWRDIITGNVIPAETYVDQPYIVICADGSWLCVSTTSSGVEGASSTHVISSRSLDHGVTWSKPVPLEPSGPPESAYATAIRVPSGRVYAFYDHNTDNIRAFRRVDGSPEPRVDEGGHFVFRYTEDGGKSWSAQRYEIPIRETEVDRKNTYGGKIRFFWHVGRPLIHKGAVYVTLHKIGGWGPPLSMVDTEGFFLRSDNLLTEPDPTKIRWTTLPDGEIGLRSPEGSVAEEQSIVELSDGSLYCVYRTVAGHPAAAYSRDDGHHWTAPAFMRYAPDGPLVKHPRAANFVWKTTDGKYLYWFHNNGGTAFRNSRNPAWLSAGHEVDTPAGKCLVWSQPEIVLYGETPEIRMSYPDFVEEHGHYYITETQKTIARVHDIPTPFLDELWKQGSVHTMQKTGLVAERGSGRADLRIPTRFDLTPASGTGGLTLDLDLDLPAGAAEQTLLQSRLSDGEGLSVSMTKEWALVLSFRGARDPQDGGDPEIAESSWDTDPGVLAAPGPHHVTFIVDNGPRIILCVVDGKLCDGGASRSFGWCRYSADIASLATDGQLHESPAAAALVRGVRVYNRHISVSEAVGNSRAGQKSGGSKQ